MIPPSLEARQHAEEKPACAYSQALIERLEAERGEFKVISVGCIGCAQECKYAVAEDWWDRDFVAVLMPKGASCVDGGK